MTTNDVGAAPDLGDTEGPDNSAKDLLPYQCVKVYHRNRLATEDDGCNNVDMAERMKKTPTGGEAPRMWRMSRAAENYLLSLAILKEDGVSPHVSELASYLRRIPPEEEVGTTLASVSGMVQRMAKDDLLVVTKDKQIELTTEGHARARDVVRRHRLSERMLVDILDVPLERAESVAHQLEHAISSELLDRIEQKLNFPDTCPYGRPIYRAGDQGIRAEEPGTLRLSDSHKGQEYLVLRIPDEDFPLLSYLVENRILPGSHIRVEDIASYRGVVDISHDGTPVSLGMEVAARVRVKAT
jgi:DtxR family Mn-dependent transcriptional regulator